MSAEQVLALVGDVSGLLEIDEFRAGLLDAIDRQIPSDWVSLNDVGPDPGDLAVIVRPELTQELVPLFAGLVHENPIYARYLETRDGRAYRFSDLVTLEELHALELHKQFYSRIGVDYQMAFTLPAGPGRTLAVALSRRTHDYSDAERDLLERARPHLIQAYRNAVAFERLRSGHAPADETRMLAALGERGLSPREAEVVHLVAVGLSNRDAAAVLGISDRTVGKHLEHAFAKLGTRSRSETATRAWALVRG